MSIEADHVFVAIRQEGIGIMILTSALRMMRPESIRKRRIFVSYKIRTFEIGIFETADSSPRYFPAALSICHLLNVGVDSGF
jgi:hypothetical protein